jgi:hypothetical protein
MTSEGNEKSCALAFHFLSLVSSFHPLSFCTFLFPPSFYHVSIPLAFLLLPVFPHIKQNFSGIKVTTEHEIISTANMTKTGLTETQ